MAQKILLTDGVKSVPIYDDGDWWDTIVPMPQQGSDREIASRVAAASRARLLTATAVANMPFALVNKKTGEDVDNSGDWQNVVKFMPDPKDLLRRLTLSLMDNNAGYLRMGKNAFKVPKQLHYVKASNIRTVVDHSKGELIRLERLVNGVVVESYLPDDPALVRFWVLDDDTELLPAQDTETKSVMSAAGIMFYSDTFTENYYRRGGVKPTLIALKGLVSKEKKEDLQKDWGSFVRGIGRRAWNSITAKIYQAEAMDIKPFGDGLGDLKETPVYKQALENIAIGRGMPMSILLSNSANKATADTEYLQWYRNDIVPRFDFLASRFNVQIFDAMGLQLQDRAETLDPEQEDEVSRVNALSQYGDALDKYPNAEVFLSSAVGVFGYELPDNHIAAIEAYYKAKADRAKAVEIQTQPNTAPTTDAQPTTDTPPMKWIPTLNHLEEARVWREVSHRRHKKGDSLDFDYVPHKGGLPDFAANFIKERLVVAKSTEDIDRAFDISEIIDIETNPSAFKKHAAPEILALANSMNELAAALNATKQLPATT